MEEKIKQIRYNAETDRLEIDGDGIHCGQNIIVLLPDNSGTPSWQRIRVEYSEKWYIPGHKGIEPAGLFAKVNN